VRKSFPPHLTAEDDGLVEREPLVHRAVVRLEDRLGVVDIVVNDAFAGKAAVLELHGQGVSQWKSVLRSSTAESTQYGTWRWTRSGH
jgi:NAD(P)-dependent dehydrogenase (short-subunit alcohol dehydrogenase family)